MKNGYIGVDIGGTNLKIALFNDDFKCIDFKSYILDGKVKPKDAIFLIKERVKYLSKGYNMRSLAVGLPGLVDYKRGYIYSLTNMCGWDNIYFKKMLRSSIKLPVFIDNDVNLAALAEHKLGNGKGTNNMLMVSLGTGVGGGLILNGQIYRGCDNATSEVGHIQLNPKGPKCNCGNRGCLESYIGNRRLLAYLKKNLKNNKSTLNKISISDLKLEDAAQAALSGDRFSKDFWDYVAVKLAQALTGVINVLNLERVIIGGGVSNAGESLLKPLNYYIKEQAMDIQGKSVKISRARFKDRSGVVGAGLLGKYNLNKRRTR